MDFTEIANIALPIIYVIVGVVLIWLIIELVVVVRRTRHAVDDVQKQLTPTLEHMEKMTASLTPACEKVDPLVERMSLTVDAANLEIMRIDQILEDVGQITDTASGAVDAIDTAANMPLELVNSVTKKVRRVFGSKNASEQSRALGSKKEEKSAVEGLINATSDAAQGAIDKRREQKEVAEKNVDGAVHAKKPAENASASSNVTSSSSQAASSKIADEEQNAKAIYFTYSNAPKSENSHEKSQGAEEVQAAAKETQPKIPTAAQIGESKTPLAAQTEDSKVKAQVQAEQPNAQESNPANTAPIPAVTAATQAPTAPEPTAAPATAPTAAPTPKPPTPTGNPVMPSASLIQKSTSKKD